MAQLSGIDSVDRTVEKTYEWVRDLRAELGDGASRRQAPTILRTVLQSLRDRRAGEFASQPPQLIRGMYYEGWDPSQTPVKLDREQFLTRIDKNTHLPDGVSAESSSHAVGKVLRQRVDAGELGNVLTSLPADLREVREQ